MSEILPMDRVRLPDGSEAVVSSAHYSCYKSPTPRQMFSICPPGGVGPYPGPLYYADECELIHRHDYKRYKGIRRCDCGEVYTTMADEMAPRRPVTWQ